jgi:hypothetical protein
MKMAVVRTGATTTDWAAVVSTSLIAVMMAAAVTALVAAIVPASWIAVVRVAVDTADTAAGAPASAAAVKALKAMTLPRHTLDAAVKAPEPPEAAVVTIPAAETASLAWFSTWRFTKLVGALDATTPAPLELQKKASQRVETDPKPEVRLERDGFDPVLPW